MSKANKSLSVMYSKDDHYPKNSTDSQACLLMDSNADNNSTTSKDENKKLKDWRFKYQSYIGPHSSIILLTIKYVALFIVFLLSIYVLWQYSQYFKDVKLQQIHIERELNIFHVNAEDKLIKLEQIQEEMKNKLEDINVLTEQGSKRIKDMFTFSKTDLLRDYEEDRGDKCEFIPLSLRFDCHPENGASEMSCAQRGCCWHPLHQLNFEKNVPLDVPYCYYPKNWSLYKYENFTKDGNDFSGLLRLQKNSFYKNDLPLIQIQTVGIDDNTLRVKIFDPLKKRYEPPFPKDLDFKPSATSNAQYELKVDENYPGFKVSRTSDKRTLFNSMGFGGFIFADQFLQISSVIPSNNIYGLGEHRTNLKLNTNWQKLTFFNSDQPPVENANLYGSHPFYMVVEKSGKAHGVLFLNSNAMEVILQPTPAITFRSIGGIFDIFFFAGPTPADVLKQYAKIVGNPFMPPYWSLGFHLCRFGYKTLENTKAVWQRTRDALIPFDTQWNDLDYMDKNNDFTYDKTKFKDLPKFIQDLHEAGMHYIPLIDAGVSASEKQGTYRPYDEGVQKSVFIKDENSGKPFIGKVWNLVSTTWPDFTNPNATAYYTEMMSDMHKSFEYDGAWIDMNEPSNFYNGHVNGCKPNSLENPPYLPKINGNLLATKTVCMSAKQYLGMHYDLHNVYGTSQAAVVNTALKQVRQKRPFIISRSTWIGHGHYAGHWTGDVFSTWHDLRMSIPEILAFSLFQIPMVGADICGFNSNTTEALCNRWMQLGAFYPFSRNHNSDDTVEQDPAAMGQMVIMSSRKALTIRYQLLPYLYTLFYRAHRYAETVARPLFIEFPEDPETFSVDTQFLWGRCLMIAPVLEEGKTSIPAYIPRGMWYDFYSQEFSFSIGKTMVIDAPLDTIPLLVRGGCILPVQEPALTTTQSRKKPFGLIIALDEKENAKGELYWDDGDSLDSIETKQYKLFKFEVVNNELTSAVIEGAFRTSMKLGTITIMGISKVVKEVFLNDKKIEFNYDKDKSVLVVDNLSLDFTGAVILKWNDKVSEEYLTTTALPSTQGKLTAAHPQAFSTELPLTRNSAKSQFNIGFLIAFLLNFIVIYFVTL